MFQNFQTRMKLRQFLIFLFICIMLSLTVGCGDEKKQAVTVQAEDGSVLRNVPDWYLDIPTNADTVYSVGTAISFDMLEAKRKAKEIAVSDLTDRYGITTAEIEKLPRDGITEKFILVKQVTKVRAYVMLAIPTDKLD